MGQENELRELNVLSLMTPKFIKVLLKHVRVVYNGLQDSIKHIKSQKRAIRILCDKRKL